MRLKDFQSNILQHFLKKMKTKYIPKNLSKWKHPDCYVGAEWHDWYVFLGQNRDSDCLTRSNFVCALEAVKAVMSKESVDDDDSCSVIVVRESHWAVGWVEWIAIHESDSEALEAADKIAEELSDYPVLDEGHFCETESREADIVWQNCYDDRERIEYIRDNENQFSFHSFSDLLACARGKYFAGYASELLH